MLLSESIEDGFVTNKNDLVKRMRLELETNNDYLEKALLQIYKYQTDEEQRAKTTSLFNGVGFNSFDAKFLSSLAEFMLNRENLPEPQRSIYRVRRHLSPKQMIFARKLMVKYAAQLIDMYVKMNVIKHDVKGSWQWTPKAERDRIKAASQQMRDAETARFKRTRFERPTGQLDLFDQLEGKK